MSQQLTITRQVYAPDARLEHMGARMDLTVEQGLADTPLMFSSSSSRIEIVFSSSSAAAIGTVESLFLHREVGGESYFLGICSPQDLEAQLVDLPDVETGLYRKATVSLTFRTETLLEEAWEALLAEINALADALTILASLDESEEVVYDYEPAACLILTRDAVRIYPTSSPVGYRLHVACRPGERGDNDPKIFLHRDDLPDRERESHSRPIAVCSPGDLADYPEDAANARQFPSLYRTAEFDIVSGDLDLIQETWANIQVEVSQLTAALEWQQTQLTGVTTTIIGYNA